MFLILEQEKRNKAWLSEIKPHVSDDEYADLIEGRMVNMNAERAQRTCDAIAGRI